MGRIEIALSSFELLPRLCENVRLIASGERAPRCSFENARFADARAGPQYKWSHQFACAHSAIELGLLKGDASSANREEAFGGVYYGAAVADVGDVFALAGDWKGDATIRKPGRGAVNVLKQDLELHTDGDRLFRALTVYDAAGDAVQKLESFGDVATASLDADFEFVVFRDVGCCLCISIRDPLD